MTVNDLIDLSRKTRTNAVKTSCEKEATIRKAELELASKQLPKVLAEIEDMASKGYRSRTYAILPDAVVKFLRLGGFTVDVKFGACTVTW